MVNRGLQNVCLEVSHESENGPKFAVKNGAETRRPTAKSHRRSNRRRSARTGPESKPRGNSRVAGICCQAENGAFEEAMAQMAADPAIRLECAAIERNFSVAESGGLTRG